MELLDLRLPQALRAPGRAGRRLFETAKINGRAATHRAHGSRRTDRGASAPLVVDCLGWRRVLGRPATSRPTPRCREAWRCIQAEPRTISRSGSTAATFPPAMPGASRQGRDPGGRRVIRAAGPREGIDRAPGAGPERDAVRYQGNWIPHQLRRATEDDIFFVGDSAGHCLPLTAEGIRTAFYFGIACGRELRRVIDGRVTRRARSSATERSPTATCGTSLGCCGSSASSPGFRHGCWRPPSGDGSDAFVRWSFTHYLRIAHPAYARELARRVPDSGGRRARLRAAA